MSRGEYQKAANLEDDGFSRDSSYIELTTKMANEIPLSTTGPYTDSRMRSSAIPTTSATQHTTLTQMQKKSQQNSTKPKKGQMMFPMSQQNDSVSVGNFTQAQGKTINEERATSPLGVGVGLVDTISDTVILRSMRANGIENRRLMKANQAKHAAAAAKTIARRQKRQTNQGSDDYKLQSSYEHVGSNSNHTLGMPRRKLTAVHQSVVSAQRQMRQANDLPRNSILSKTYSSQVPPLQRNSCRPVAQPTPGQLSILRGQQSQNRTTTVAADSNGLINLSYEQPAFAAAPGTSLGHNNAAGFDESQRLSFSHVPLGQGQGQGDDRDAQMNIRGSQTTALDSQFSQGQQQQPVTATTRLIKKRSHMNRVYHQHNKTTNTNLIHINRPRTGYQVRTRGNAANNDILSQISSQKHIDQASAQYLNQTNSDFYGKNKNYISLNSHRSHGVNSKIRAIRQHKSNQNFYPRQTTTSVRQKQRYADADVLSDAVHKNINRQNINEASASSFVLSDTRGETTAHYNPSNRNFSHTGSLNRLAQVVTVQSIKDEETILSVNVPSFATTGVQPYPQPQHHQYRTERNSQLKPKPESRLGAGQHGQSMPRPTNQNGAKSKKQKQLILFTGSGDQVRLDVPTQEKSLNQAKSRQKQLRDQSIRKWINSNRQATKPIMTSQHLNYAALQQSQLQQHQGIAAPGYKKFVKPLGSTAREIRFRKQKPQPHNLFHEMTKRNRDLETPEELDRLDEDSSTQLNPMAVTDEKFNQTEEHQHQPLQIQDFQRITPSPPQQQDYNLANDVAAVQKAPSSFERRVKTPPVVNDYKVEQVKSLLEHTVIPQDYTLTTQSKHEDSVNHGSVQLVLTSEEVQLKPSDNSQLSIVAKNYVTDLFELAGVTPKAAQDQADYFDSATISQHVKQLDEDATSDIEVFAHRAGKTTPDNQHGNMHGDPDGLFLTGQSSILKSGDGTHTRLSKSFNQRKQVSIRETITIGSDNNDPGVAAKSVASSQRGNNPSRVLIKNHLHAYDAPQPITETTAKKLTTRQSRYHTNCGSDRNSSEKHGVKSQQSSRISGRQRPPKFIENGKLSRMAKQKLSLSQADLNALAKVQDAQMSLNRGGGRMHMSTSHGTHPIVVKNYASATGDGSEAGVKVTTRSIPRRKKSKASTAMNRSARMTQSSRNDNGSKKRAVFCDECKRRTIDKPSNPESGKIEHGGFKVTKGGSSAKGSVGGGGNNNNIWTSRLHEMSSQRSIFTTSKKGGIGCCGNKSMNQSMMSNNSNYKKILNRTFNISKDLTKYTKNLDYNQSQRKLTAFDKTARGRNLGQMRLRAEVVATQKAKWDKERETLKNVDWEDSDLFEAFKECKGTRQPIESVLQKFATLKTATADKMYTDVELQYFIGLIQKKDCKKDSDEVQAENRSQIVLQYFNRSLYTLQALTKLLMIDFHYDRLFKKYETDYTVNTVIMLMTRARKMYNAIEMIMTIIKLIEKLRMIENPTLSDRQDGSGQHISKLGKHVSAIKTKLKKSPADGTSPAATQLKNRIRVHIKSFLAQHTLFPVQFRYAGVDQLTHLKPPAQNRADSHLSGESRIINLKLGGGRNSRVSSRNSLRSSFNGSAKSQKSQKGSQNNDQSAKLGKKKKKSKSSSKFRKLQNSKKQKEESASVRMLSSRNSINDKLLTPVRSTSRVVDKKHPIVTIDSSNLSNV